MAASCLASAVKQKQVQSPAPMETVNVDIADGSNPQQTQEVFKEAKASC